MSETLEQLEEHAARYRNHIQKIRIDFPEAADARRQELHEIYRKIAIAKRATPLNKEEGAET